MRKITLLIICLIGYASYGQVNISEAFNSGAGDFTGSYSNSTEVACDVASMRDNLYDYSATGDLTSANQVGASNGTDLNVSFDYKILDYPSGFYDPPGPETGPGWGSADVQYSTDGGTNWTTVLTINDDNHVASLDCATMMATIPAASLPNGSDVQLRISNTWSAGDYYFYVDNFVAQQELGCTAAVVDTVSIVDDCANSQFTIDVVVTTVNDGAQFNDGTNTFPIVAGSNILGPYTDGSSVDITVEHSVAACDFSLDTQLFVCPPVNDVCSGAIDVACDETVTGDTSADGVTDTVGNASADLWYSYSGPAGDITASLCDSSYDTNVRVYDSCGGTQIANNDDSCGSRSEVTFTADGSSTYYIAVEGYSSFVGAFTMTLTCLETIPPPANDTFAGAEALVTGVATSGTTAGATENLADDKPSCDMFGNIADVWYTYTQPSNTDTMIITTSISGTSSEANCAVYSAGEPILEENQVACGDEGQALGEMLEFAATPGTTYYIRVWSDGALPPVSGRVEGTFNVTADAALSTDEFDNPAVFTYYPNPVKNTLTLNAQNNIEDVRMYNMLGQEVMNAQPQAVDSDIDMSSLETGTYFVQVTIASITKTVRVVKQ